MLHVVKVLKIVSGCYDRPSQLIVWSCFSFNYTERNRSQFNRKVYPMYKNGVSFRQNDIMRYSYSMMYDLSRWRSMYEGVQIVLCRVLTVCHGGFDCGQVMIDGWHIANAANVNTTVANITAAINPDVRLFISITTQS